MAEMNVGQVQQTEEDAEPAEFEGSFSDMLQYIATAVTSAGKHLKT